MTIQFPLRGLVLMLITAGALAGCGGPSPEASVASAKAYLDQHDSKAAIIELKNALSEAPNQAEARYLLGKALLQSGDAVGAEVELRKASQLGFDANQVLPTLAETLVALGQGKKVLDELADKTVQGAEPQATLLTSVGIARAMQGQLPEARAAIDEALRIRPDHDPALLAQARLKLVDRDIAGALERLDAATAKNPRNHEAWTLKADILNFQGQTDAALAAYGKAIEAKPNFGPAQTALAMAYLRQNKLDEVAKRVEAMKKVMPNQLQTVLVETLLAYQKKEFTQARDLVMQIQKNVPDDPRILLLAGAIQMQLNALLQAESMLTKAHKLNPAADAPRRLLAELYMRSGLPAKAVDLIEPVAGNIKDAKLASLAGMAYLQSGDARKANDYFNLASTLSPEDKAIKVNAALSQMALGQKDAGFSTLEHIASEDTGVSADMALISAALRQGAHDQALRAIDALARKMPGSPVPDALRGTAMASKGAAAEARKFFEKALAIDAKYYPAVASLAALDVAENKVPEARKRFEALVKVDAKNSQAWLAIAELDARAGAAPAKVAESLNQAVKAGPTDLRARLAQINHRLAQKEAKQAVTDSQEALKAIPDKPELLDALARAQAAAGDTTGALATFDKVLKQMPDNPQPLLRMAELQMAAKQKDAATQSLKKALELKPDFVPAQRGLIMLHLADKQTEPALALARSVQQQRPKEAVGYLLEGDIQAVKKAWTEAAQAYQTGAKLQPAAELAIKWHGALKNAGKAAEADKMAQSWLAAHPKDHGFAMYAGQMALNANDYASAVRLYQSVLKALPKDVAVLNNYAWALSRMNDPRALEYAERAYALAPKSPEVMDTLAMLLAKKGDTKRALGLLEEAHRLAPQGHDIRLNLAKVLLQAGRQSEALAHLNALEKLGNTFSGNAEVRGLLANALKR